MKMRKGYFTKRMEIKNGVVITTLCIMLSLCACSANSKKDSIPIDNMLVEDTVLVEEINAGLDKTIYEELSVQEEIIEDIEVAEEVYSYNVEEKKFSFCIDEIVYVVPYVQISDCPDASLEWKINHTLWKEACWILDCAEIGDEFYCLFETETQMQIIGTYKCGQFLSVVYESTFIDRLPGRIVYAIVVDTLTGERILLEDMIKNPNKLGEILLHYFDNQDRELALFITEEKVESILNYAGMTETEIVNYNLTCNGKYPELLNGEVGSVSYLFDASSFYMTEEAFVVLPGAYYYEPLIFEWERVEEAVHCKKVIREGEVY